LDLGLGIEERKAKDRVSELSMVSPEFGNLARGLVRAYLTNEKTTSIVTAIKENQCIVAMPNVFCPKTTKRNFRRYED